LPFAKFPKLDFIKSLAEIWGKESATLIREDIELNIIARPITKRTAPPINTAIPRLIQKHP
jgi:hypothetical protein